MKHKIYYIIDKNNSNRRIGTTTYSINDAYKEMSRLNAKMGGKDNLEIKEVIKPAMKKSDLSNLEIDKIEGDLFSKLMDNTTVAEQAANAIGKIIGKTKKPRNKGKKKSK